LAEDSPVLHEIGIQPHHTPAKGKIKQYFCLQRLELSTAPQIVHCPDAGEDAVNKTELFLVAF
jgi:hypothetical protein